MALISFRRLLKSLPVNLLTLACVSQLTTFERGYHEERTKEGWKRFCIELYTVQQNMKSALFIQHFNILSIKLRSEWRCCTVYKSVISKLCNEKLRGGVLLIGYLQMGKGTLNS